MVQFTTTYIYIILYTDSEFAFPYQFQSLNIFLEVLEVLSTLELPVLKKKKRGVS